MPEQKIIVDSAIHHKLAAELFNLTWDLIEKTERTTIDDETMVHAAHASRFHWGVVGTPLNFARGEWLISRVYALVNRPESALVHAEKSIELCLNNGLGRFDLGFAYEATARAHSLFGDVAQRDIYIGLATQAAEQVAKELDRVWLLKNVNTVTSLSLPT